MTIRTVTIIGKHDLTHLALRCQNDKCRTKVSVVAASPVITKCPACGTVFDNDAQAVQRAFEVLVTALARTSADIEFELGEVKP